MNTQAITSRRLPEPSRQRTADRQSASGGNALREPTAAPVRYPRHEHGGNVSPAGRRPPRAVPQPLQRRPIRGIDLDTELCCDVTDERAADW